MIPGHLKRLEFVEKFKNQVDLYGRGFQEIDCKEDGLRDYMFSIAVENAVYDTYFTEKLTDCFATGTIPIFYGCRGVTEYFNEDGIIFLDDDFDVSTLTEELYYSKMDAIKDNYQRSLEFPVAEDYIYTNYFQMIYKYFKDNDVKVEGAIHVGAHRGEEIYDYEKLGAKKVVWIEPNPEVFEELVCFLENAETSVESTGFCVAAGDSDNDEIDFHVCYGPDAGYMVGNKG